MAWQFIVGLAGLIGVLALGAAIWFGLSWLVLLAVRAIPLAGRRRRER